VVTRDAQRGQRHVLLQARQLRREPADRRITFQGVTRIDPTAVATELTGDPAARNTLEAPETIVPTTREVTGLTTTSRFTLPGYSVMVLRVTEGV
jgi:alpha-L-arabinofuranosidase